MRPMRVILQLIGCLAPFTLVHSAEEHDSAGWETILDEKLTQWEIFLGPPHVSVVVPGYTHAADPKQDKPLGLNSDPLHVFTVRAIGGEPVLHITGEIFGTITTLKEYGDFHLRVQFRWGAVKHAPRLNAPRDNGILYRCFGPQGATGGFWKRSLECQVQENDIGDLYSLGGTAGIAALEFPNPRGGKPLWHYVPGAPLRRFGGRCAHGEDYHELPNGEWNTIEIMAVGDRSLHILNGRVVNVLQNTQRAVDGRTQALVSGQIQIQSEGAEAEYRRLEIRPLVRFPSEYQALFAPAASPTAK